MDITDNVNLIQTADDGTRTAKRGFNSNNRYFEQIETDNGGGGSTVAIPSIYTISNGGNITVSTSTTPNATFENVRTFTLGVDADSTVTSGSTKPVTSGAVYSSLLDKQDTLVSGTNIKTINGSSVLGSGDLSITASSDGLTIDTNSNGELQAIGVIEKNAGNVKYDWVGTLAEYTAQNVATLHPDWVCYITDDEIQTSGDFVVSYKTPTASDPTWYRKYASGWVEQGGIYTISSTAYADYPLLIEMADMAYTILANNIGGTSNSYAVSFNVSSFTTTSFSAKTGASSMNFSWQVKGMAK